MEINFTDFTAIIATGTGIGLIIFLLLKILMLPIKKKYNPCVTTALVFSGLGALLLKVNSDASLSVVILFGIGMLVGYACYWVMFLIKKF
jgi:hypothetical protein